MTPEAQAELETLRAKLAASERLGSGYKGRAEELRKRIAELEGGGR